MFGVLYLGCWQPWGEFVANTLLAHGDTFIGPPASTIAPLTSFSLPLAALGVYQMVPLF
jgi:hypothetical protein